MAFAGAGRKYDFVVVGGGILGVAVAKVASNFGLSVLVLRLKDTDVPRADTLRNQAWLQSGFMYRINAFKTKDDYREFAISTFEAGRRLLQELGLPLPPSSAVVGAKRADKIADLEEKIRLLGSSDSLRRLEPEEAAALLGEFAEQDKVYFSFADAPFAEADVLMALREKTVNATFIELSEPAWLEPRDANTIRIHCGSWHMDSTMTLIAAGAASFELVRQIGGKLDGGIQKTPLLVSHQCCPLPAKIFADRDLHFSAVQHACEGLEHGAIVVGTLSSDFPVPFTRKIETPMREKLEKCLHPLLSERLLPGGRITAGCEVIPDPRTGISQYQPWIEPNLGPAMFASPGRATVAAMAAQEVVDRILDKLGNGKASIEFQFDDRFHSVWDSPSAMHFTGKYSFNDAEPSA